MKNHNIESKTKKSHGFYSSPIGGGSIITSEDLDTFSADSIGTNTSDTTSDATIVVISTDIAVASDTAGAV